MIWREGDSLGIILEQLKKGGMQAEWCSKTLGPFWGGAKDGDLGFCACEEQRGRDWQCQFCELNEDPRIGKSICRMFGLQREFDVGPLGGDSCWPYGFPMGSLWVP